MPLWKRLWLLFSVIWVVVGAINVATIAALEEDPGGKIVAPLALTLAVPVAVYLLAWAWAGWRARNDGEAQ